MRIIACIIEAAMIQTIPGHPGEPMQGPRLPPARGPPLCEMPDRGADAINGHAQTMPDQAFGKRVAWQGTRRQDSLVVGDACLWPPARQISVAQVGTSTDNGRAGRGFRGLPGVFGATAHGLFIAGRKLGCAGLLQKIHQHRRTLDQVAVAVDQRMRESRAHRRSRKVAALGFTRFFSAAS